MNVVPKRGDTLDWKFKGQFKCRLSSIDIDVLKEFHGEDCVTVLDGFEFTKKIHSTQLFQHMLQFKQIKQEQDKAKLKDEEYIKFWRNIMTSVDLNPDDKKDELYAVK